MKDARILKIFESVMGFTSDTTLRLQVGRRLLADAGQESDLAKWKKAVEFAGYMATGAEAMLNVLNDVAAVRIAVENDEATADDLHAAEERLSDHWRGLREDIFEFRKRVPATAAPQALLSDHVPPDGGSFPLTSDYVGADTPDAPLPIPRTDAAREKFIQRTYTGECVCVDAEDMAELEREFANLLKTGIIPIPNVNRLRDNGMYYGLQRLGLRLAELLDEDQFNSVEQYLDGIGSAIHTLQSQYSVMQSTCERRIRALEMALTSASVAIPSKGMGRQEKES